MAKMLIFDEESRKRARFVLDNIAVDKRWVMTIEREKSKRTLSQSALYFKWIGIIARETGNDPDAVHEAFKMMFLIPTEIKLGEQVVLWRSTTKLDIGPMSDYMTRVYNYAASELGIFLPTPEDLHQGRR